MGVHKLRLDNYIYFYYAANHLRVPVSVVACMRCHAYNYADGSRRRRRCKRSLRLTPTIYV